VDLNTLLFQCVQAGASDIHLKLGRAPMVRLDGAVQELPGTQPLSDAALDEYLRTVTAIAPQRYDTFQETGDLDIAYTAGDLPRFRVNAFRQRGATSFALRVIPKKVPRFEDLGLPGGIQKLAEEHRGLVLVTGATGSGKTTTLAAIIDYINRTRQSHIVTIEDPIEILHPDHQSIVNQREVGLDTENFGQALRRALRQDPDTILIGELRDAETAQTALQAAESGHLVFSTLHTIDAAETVGRMIEFFPEGKQAQIRSVMAGVLRGVISQRLLPRVGGGRVAAVEVMINNARIGDLIRDNKPEMIEEAVAEGDFFQMQTFQKALIDKVIEGVVDREVAANASTNRHDFMVALEYAEKARNAGIDTNSPAAAQVAKPEGEPEPQAEPDHGLTLTPTLAPPTLAPPTLAPPTLAPPQPEPEPQFAPLRLAPLGE
jgi:twitching motility protein PilT